MKIKQSGNSILNIVLFLISVLILVSMVFQVLSLDSYHDWEERIVVLTAMTREGFLFLRVGIFLVIFCVYWFDRTRRKKRKKYKLPKILKLLVYNP